MIIPCESNRTRDDGCVWGVDEFLPVQVFLHLVELFARPAIRQKSFSELGSLLFAEIDRELTPNS